jgi:hypothetical protein
MPTMGFLNVGSNIQNGVAKKRGVVDSSDITRMIRQTAAYRPYGDGGAQGNYLPKIGRFPSQSARLEWSLGRKFGPLFDANYLRH